MSIARRIAQGWPASPLWWIALGCVYASSIALRMDTPLYGDELRYVAYAKNLAAGHYAMAADGALRNGPGLPLWLLPWVAMGFEGSELRLLNVPLLLLALAYTHAMIRQAAGPRAAAIATALLAVHPPLVWYGTRVLSELPATVLIAGFGYFFLRWHRDPTDRRALVAASLHLGLLALTKVTYGYAIVVLLGLFAVLRLRPGWYRRLVPRGAIEGLLSLAFLCCVPYLVYTWSQTSHLFYWGTNGGETLYWMSVGGEDMWGNWMSRKDVAEHPDLEARHGHFLDELRAKPAVERDALFKQRAVERIRAHPGVYLKNWVANCARLLFNMPYSKRPQSLGTYGFIFPNMLLVVGVLGSLAPAWVGRRRLDGGVLVLVGMVAMVAGANTLPSNTGRHFIPATPIVGLWLATICAHSLRIQLLRGAAAQVDANGGGRAPAPAARR